MLGEVPHMILKPITKDEGAQRWANPTSVRILAHGMGVIVLCVMLCGCNSIYHQTWATMPADPEARRALRLEEARVVDRRARTAARQLLTLLQQSSDQDRIRVGFDRLEKDALELERKLLAVGDELGAGVENQEIEALKLQAKTWRQFAIENRTVNSQVAARRLELLLVSLQLSRNGLPVRLVLRQSLGWGVNCFAIRQFTLSANRRGSLRIIVVLC